MNDFNPHVTDSGRMTLIVCHVRMHQDSEKGEQLKQEGEEHFKKKSN